VCNDFGNRIPYDDYRRAFSRIRVPVSGTASHRSYLCEIRPA
jgi:hypothetical protein